jgi:pyruvate kinase
LRAACKATNIFCAVLLDTKGPEIRTGLLENGEAVYLEQGSTITLSTDYAAVSATKGSHLVFTAVTFFC